MVYQSNDSEADADFSWRNEMKLPEGKKIIQGRYHYEYLQLIRALKLVTRDTEDHNWDGVVVNLINIKNHCSSLKHLKRLLYKPNKNLGNKNKKI